MNEPYTRTTLRCGCALFDGNPPLRVYCDEHPAPVTLITLADLTPFTESQATKDLPPGAFYNGRIAKEEEVKP